MAQLQQHEEKSDQEFGKNRVTSSRYLFYLSVAILLAFVAGCSFNLYRKSQYQAHPKVEVQESSQYTPKYKS